MCACMRVFFNVNAKIRNFYTLYTINFSKTFFITF